MDGWVDGRWEWQLRWRRNRFEWEVSQEHQLLQAIENTNFQRDQVDSWSWECEPSGMFSVKSAYTTIYDSSSLVGETNVPYFFWSIPAPSKVHYFMWRLVNSGIPIVDNLIRRNITLEPQQTLCPFFKSDAETVSHIFCTCPLSDKVWKQCLSWINCPSPLPMQVIQHLSFLPGMLHS
uniref:Reverse transcriptase zinc-binding domain-containing protein n=1 Tax=Cajanus cajan TaxID=3821 RepID=A0A151RP13_CAJCA|nr:hypothetical protein KK1_034248 [Cajanus cajan]